MKPFKFGMLGSTDSHVGVSAVEEDNYFGKVALYERNPHRWDHVVIDYKSDPRRTVVGWEMLASGYAGVWAKENTREAIFDAMMRKEVYATTGPRMTVRFFGGDDFQPDDAMSRTPAAIGYEKGVPMGGDLPTAPPGKPPTFLVGAMKDPFSGNLDRIQIVKGWLDATGALQEKVYDVAWSGDRKPNADGKLPSVGDTVDVANATSTNGSARRSCSRRGRTPRSTRPSRPSTTPASSRSRRHAGRRTTRSVSASGCRTTSR